jgi:hypothetical protein
MPYASVLQEEANLGAADRNMRVAPVVLGFIIILTLVSCTFGAPNAQQAAEQTNVRATQIEVYVQQTLLAQQSIADLQDSQTPPPVTSLPSRAAPSSTPQPQASPVSPNPATSTASPAAPAATAQPTPATIDQTSFDTWIKSANILLYEDMTARLDTLRFVKATLDKMALKYKDDGSAKGWLRNDLSSGATGGKPWDLVIIAAEDKEQAENEFFDYVTNALDQGSSVIFEVWYLNKAYANRAGPILARCGVEYSGDRTRVPPGSMVLFPLDAGNVLLNVPNKNLSFTNTSSYWWSSSASYDTGDLLSKAPKSQAELVLGISPDNREDHATLVRCLNGQLILQTFSSHTLAYESIGPLWQNLIYNALKTRFDTLQK